MAYGRQSNLYLALNMYDRALELEPSGLPLLHSEGQFRKAHLTIGRWRKYKIANLCFLPQKAYLCGSVTSTNRRNEHHPEKKQNGLFYTKAEERINTLSHAAGILMGVVVGTIFLVKAIRVETSGLYSASGSTSSACSALTLPLLSTMR